jgi:HJR/Mrr/RecB family endonuclease
MRIYRPRYVKKKELKHSRSNRILKMHCDIHGDLIGQSDDYNIIVYESLDDIENKIIIKCFKCIDEKVRMQKEHNYSLYEKANKESYRKFGKKVKVFEHTSSILFFIALFGSVYFIYLWGWIEGLVPTSFFLIMGIISYVRGEELKKQYHEYRTQITPKLPYVTETRLIVDSERKTVEKWIAKKEKIRNEKVDYTFEEIDKMTGIQFENYIKNLLSKIGYENAETTKASGDEGVDIFAFKNEKKIAIQCKRYEGKVSNSAIQEVFSGMHYYECEEAIVITNSTFTESAVTLAKKHKVKLINRNGLFDLIEKANGHISTNYVRNEDKKSNDDFREEQNTYKFNINEDKEVKPKVIDIPPTTSRETEQYEFLNNLVERIKTKVEKHWLEDKVIIFSTIPSDDWIGSLYSIDERHIKEHIIMAIISIEWTYLLSQIRDLYKYEEVLNTVIINKIGEHMILCLHDHYLPIAKGALRLTGKERESFIGLAIHTYIELGLVTYDEIKLTEYSTVLGRTVFSKIGIGMKLVIK